jgi:hypothetical protein
MEVYQIFTIVCIFGAVNICTTVVKHYYEKKKRDRALKKIKYIGCLYIASIGCIIGYDWYMHKNKNDICKQVNKLWNRLYDGYDKHNNINEKHIDNDDYNDIKYYRK